MKYHKPPARRALAEFIDPTSNKVGGSLLNRLRTRAAVTCVTEESRSVFFRPYLRRHNHDGESVALSRYSPGRLLLERRSKRPPPLANFTALLTLAFISGSARVREDRTAPQRARAKLHAPSETIREFFPV